MADSTPVFFNGADATRIAKSVAAYERTQPDPKNPKRNIPGQLIFFWAIITGNGLGPDGTTPVYSWTEQRRVSTAPTVTWEAVPGGRTGALPGGTPDYHTWAMATNNINVLANNQIVLMQQSFDSQGTPFYTFDPPVNTTGSKYMVYQLTGTNGPAIFDWPRVGS